MSIYECMLRDVNNSTLQHPNHVDDISGTYSVEFRAYSGVGCYGSETQNIVVETTPVASFTVNNPCSGDTTVFTNATAISIGSADS